MLFRKAILFGATLFRKANLLELLLLEPALQGLDSLLQKCSWVCCDVLPAMLAAVCYQGVTVFCVRIS